MAVLLWIRSGWEVLMALMSASKGYQATILLGGAIHAETKAKPPAP